jgi:hypothetical protein
VSDLKTMKEGNIEIKNSTTKQSLGNQQEALAVLA